MSQREANDAIRAYDGDDPYVFVSYSHANEKEVRALIAGLVDQGINVWFDEGISPGARWTESLAEAIEACSAFLLVVTRESVDSDHCLNEVQFALNRKKPFLAVHLHNLKLPPHLELSIGNRQAIMARSIHGPIEVRVADAISTLTRTRSNKKPTGTTTRRKRVIGAVITAALLISGISLLIKRGTDVEQHTDLTNTSSLDSRILLGQKLSSYDLESILDSLKEQEQAESPTLEPKTMTDLATTYYYMGCFEEAAVYFARTIESSGATPLSLGDLANACHFIPSETSKAVKLWAEAISQVTSSYDSHDWLAQAHLAVYHAHLGNRQAAQKAIHSALQTTDDPAIAHFMNAVVQSVSGREDVAGRSKRLSINAGFSAEIMALDPLLNSPRQCPLQRRVAPTSATCSHPATTQ